MANKKYVQLVNGILTEDAASLLLTSELAASTGATLVGVDDSGFTTISGATLQAILASIDGAIDAAGDVDSVNGETGVVVLDGTDIDSTHTAVNYTAAAADLDSHLAGIDAEIGNIFSNIASPFNYQGAFDASAGDFAAISPASVGDWYKITVAGTIGAVTYDVGDNLLINKNVAGTVVTADVDKIDNTDQVTSVNGLQGDVVLSSDDIDSDATINSGTPAGDTITDDLNAIDAALVQAQSDISDNASAISDNTSDISDNAAAAAAALKGDILTGFVASGALNAGDPVFKSSSTEVSKAFANADSALEIIGIAAATVADQEAVNVIPFGESGAIYSGLSDAQPVFLLEAGGVGNTAPTTSGAYVLRIGKATSTTSIDVETKNVPVKLA
jgi:hypothetical protein